MEIETTNAASNEQSNEQSGVVEGISPGLTKHQEINQKEQDVYSNGIVKEEGSWFLAPGVPGVGEKPEFFNDSTFDTILDQAKAHPELRKKLGSVPNEYKIELGEGYEDVKIQEDNPLLEAFTKEAKEHKLSQEAFNKTVKIYVDYEKNAIKRENERLLAESQKELESIGPDYQQKLDDLLNWYGQNFGEEKIPAFRSRIQTKADYDDHVILREKMGYAKVQANDAPTSAQRPFELQSMMADSRYAMDMSYTKMVDDEYRKHYGQK